MRNPVVRTLGFLPAWVIIWAAVFCPAAEDFTSARKRMVVATQGVTRYFFAYPAIDHEWDELDSLQNTHLLEIVHRPDNDSIYAIEKPYETELSQMLTLSAN